MVPGACEEAAARLQARLTSALPDAGAVAFGLARVMGKAQLRDRGVLLQHSKYAGFPSRIGSGGSGRIS